MSRTTPGPRTRRTMTAAARAATKRAERGHRAPAPETSVAVAGRTVLIEAPKNGWEDPPEPSFESFDEDAPPKDEVEVHPRGRRLLTPLLGVLLLAALVATAVLGWQYRDGHRTESARTQALTAAQKAAPLVLSYDYRHLDKDFASAHAHLTGGFHAEYGKTTKAVVGPTAKKYRAVVKATIAAPATGTPAASVVSASPDKVVVLLFINQVTESTQVSGARVDLNRVRMTMTRTDGGWKVSGVDAL
ncbi:hypothetical protein DMH26_34205 [Streptomyces sp. WAC 05379]|uniref:hypothetical protein n=1 Tax=Streptomyces sp. WAC 05379 TaxID=2203207 RepID=UPI000F740C11|nr:hypothetical protein [Streptomyces sp. WAC 05379]RSN85344.1 hypothetical protein DMH26_34205 [Streptomyces sp. WAC 05379]